MTPSGIRTADQHFVQPAAWAESQLAVAVPSVVHSTWLAPLPTTGQRGVLHAPVAQVRSHLQAAEQSTVSHASVPVQVIAQCEPASHVMLLHALPPVQLIVHVQPDGHVTLPQLSALVQSTGQIIFSSSHCGQSAGQFGITQKLLLQTRLSVKPAQSVVVEHAYFSVGRSTRHAATSAALIRAPRVRACMAQQLLH